MRIFKEEQRFTQLWLIILLIMSAIVPVIILVKEYLSDKISFTKLLWTLSLIIVATCFIFFFKLKTKIDEKGIHYQFFPFHLKFKTIKWNEIEKIYVRTYDPISEYGGWGLKGGAFWNSEKGIAINVSGDIGIQLELKNGKKVLIGTQLKNKAEQTIKHYKK